MEDIGTVIGRVMERVRYRVAARNLMDTEASWQGRFSIDQGSDEKECPGGCVKKAHRPGELAAGAAGEKTSRCGIPRAAPGWLTRGEPASNGNPDRTECPARDGRTSNRSDCAPIGKLAASITPDAEGDGRSRAIRAAEATASSAMNPAAMVMSGDLESAGAANERLGPLTAAFATQTAMQRSFASQQAIDLTAVAAGETDAANIRNLARITDDVRISHPIGDPLHTGFASDLGPA